MPRHPGLQLEMRMRELSAAITRASTGVQIAFNDIRQLEEKAYELKKKAASDQQRLDELLELQRDLIAASRVTEFGLPSGMTNEEFEKMTGTRITS